MRRTRLKILNWSILNKFTAPTMFVAWSLASPAHALDFNFSFSNVTGNADGTVTGEIFGLTNNATSAASDIVIDSAPAGWVLPAIPFSVFSHAGDWSGGYIDENSFTVSNGVLTDANFQIYGGYFDLNYDNTYNEFGDLRVITGVVPPTGPYIQNTDGFGGVTYTAVPEPSTWAMMGLGFASLGLAGYRRRRLAPARAATA